VQKEPVGGAARFATALKSLPNNPLVFFGGDAFNPRCVGRLLLQWCSPLTQCLVNSLASSITRGMHMVSVLNELNIAVAVVGNHDLG
jgi:2',3'-cyclic-nucleotide 2'-phosphodiesterase (5'-nucleotidase family)